MTRYFYLIYYVHLIYLLDIDVHYTIGSQPLFYFRINNAITNYIFLYFVLKIKTNYSTYLSKKKKFNVKLTIFAYLARPLSSFCVTYQVETMQGHRRRRFPEKTLFY